MSYCRPTLLLCLFAATLGCGTRPRAPALEDGPVYQNDRAGFRFLVPEGWSQYARSEIPPGPLSKERLLVQYRQIGGGHAGVLEASVNELPESKDLGAYLAGSAEGAQSWRLAQEPEKIDIDQNPATRFIFQAKISGGVLTREVVAFRRGERVYFFTGIFPTSDASSRAQIRKALASIVWKS